MLVLLFSAGRLFSNRSREFQLLRSRERELRLEDCCDEFPGRRGSNFVIPVASEPTMGSLACDRSSPTEGDEMPEHKIGTQEEWQAARDELAKLEAEQAARRC
jgi:hypothetical protein